MLQGIHYIVVFTMVHDSAGYSMLHYFAADSGERYWPVALDLCLVALVLLEDRSDVCLAPVNWNFTGLCLFV